MGLRGETFEKDGTMKVLLGFNDIRPDGMGSAALTLIRALRAQGVEVVALHAWHQIDLPGYEEEVKPSFVEGNEAFGVDGETLGRMVAKVNGMVKEGDVFIHFGAPNWAACIPYFVSGLRIVTAVHSINPSTLKLCRAYASRVSAFVCISEGVRRRFLKGLPKSLHSRVSLIPNAVADCPEPKANYTQKAPLRILYVGRIEDTSKGCGKLPGILAALGHMGVDAQLDLFGYFHNWETQFWAAVDRAGVRERVHYRGEIAHEAMYRTMREYDVFLATPNFEGFGLSIAEAMMAGLPCVASSIEGVTDWIFEEGRSGLLVGKMDICGFAIALARIAREPGLAERLGRAGRERIRTLASFEAHGRMYADLVRRVASEADYSLVEPPCALEHYVQPEALKSWWLARLLPVRLKTWLRRFM